MEGADPEKGAFDSAAVVCVANLVVITAQSNAGGARLLGSGWPIAATPVATMDRVSIPMTNIAASFGFIIATLLRLRFACHETRG